MLPMTIVDGGSPSSRRSAPVSGPGLNISVSTPLGIETTLPAEIRRARGSSRARRSETATTTSVRRAAAPSSRRSDHGSGLRRPCSVWTSVRTPARRAASDVLYHTPLCVCTTSGAMRPICAASERGLSSDRRDMGSATCSVATLSNPSEKRPRYWRQSRCCSKRSAFVRVIRSATTRSMPPQFMLCTTCSTRTRRVVIGA